MHSRFVRFLCAVAFFGTLGAQTVDLFGGYSFTRVKPEQNFNHASMNGWNSSATFWTGSRLGITTDFAGSYGALNLSSDLNSVPARQHSFLAGPQVRLFSKEKVDTSFRVLFGAAHGSVSDPVTVPSGLTYKSLNETAFASLIGTNFDVNISRRLGLRFSPGLYLTQFNGETQKNFRFSVGPVFHFHRE